MQAAKHFMRAPYLVSDFIGTYSVYERGPSERTLYVERSRTQF